jgi:hypothetical protein
MTRQACGGTLEVEGEHMLSGKLVHLIESHWEDIVSRVIAEVRRDPQLTHFRSAVEADMRESGRILLRDLGHWLGAGNKDEIVQHYEHLGALRFQDGMPLHEAVRVVALVRERVLDFVEERLETKTTLALYEEEELDRRLGRFFDLLTIHMVKGYEEAMRREFRAPAAAAGSHGSPGANQ